ncbi:ABC transporter permease [Acrocarpospora macrocephala]|uniref:ABC3 transporter permease C-terminal domain-containing protein n=1 Tax=Acrocarpospora macrocephala TaxID=150177 RepID=A0A5M3X5Y3_9ACTN|nr:ABC transporter permease [Acrocarpospora macrocephala]GES14303.1 hypothetical protein Amac_079000 [Acrocarpospora macrocephala]
MIRLIWPGLAARRSSLTGSFLALALGVALCAAAGAALVAALDPPGDRPLWYATPDVVIAGPDRAGGRGEPGNAVLPPGERGHVPPGIPARLAALDGAGRMIVDMAAYARLDGATEAHPWSAAALHPGVFLAGGPPRTDGQVVLPAPTARRPGDPVTVATADGPRRFVVSGVLATPAPQALYVADATAARLARGRIAAVALFTPSADADALAARARVALADRPELRVLTGESRRSAHPDPDAGLLLVAITLLGESAAVACLVSAFVVAGAFTFTVAQRRREFGLLRAAGATLRQIRRLVLGEALGVGVLAGLAGCALGAAIAEPFARRLAAAGLAPPGFTVRITPWPMAAAFTLGVVVAVVGAWRAAHRAAAVRPVEALREAAVERPAMTWVRWLAGLACLAGIVPIIPLMRTPEGAAYLLVVVLLLIFAGAALAPAVVPFLVRTLTVAGRGPVRVLARESALAAVRRTAATAVPVLATVGLAGASLAGTATLSAAQALGARDHVTASAVVIPAGAAALPDPAAATAERVPGVTAAVRIKQTFAYDRDDRMIRQHAAWYVDGAAAARVLRLPVTAGSAAGLTGDTVAVSQSLAEAHGWRVGTKAALWLGDGALVLPRVVATFRDRLGLPAVLLPWTTLHEHSSVPLPDAVYLALAPGAERAVEDAVRPLGGTLTSTGKHLSTVDAEFDTLSRLALLAIVGMAVVYTAISIVNVQLMAAGERARELAMLRLAGATPRQVLLIVAHEATLVGVAGGLLAGGVTAATLTAVTAALSPLVSAVPIVVPWAPLLATSAGCVLVALLTSLACAVPAARRTISRPG